MNLSFCWYACPRNVPGMYQECPGNVTGMSRNVPEMSRKCPGNVPGMSRKCPGNVPRMSPECPPNVPGMSALFLQSASKGKVYHSEKQRKFSYTLLTLCTSQRRYNKYKYGTFERPSGAPEGKIGKNTRYLLHFSVNFFFMIFK